MALFIETHLFSSFVADRGIVLIFRTCYISNSIDTDLTFLISQKTNKSERFLKVAYITNNFRLVLKSEERTFLQNGTKDF